VGFWRTTSPARRPAARQADSDGSPKQTGRSDFSRASCVPKLKVVPDVSCEGARPETTRTTAITFT
jgi:hypothetical protein